MTVVLDSHLLLLLIVGTLNPAYITKHRRLHPAYGGNDFIILRQELAGATRIVVTPNTLTEASNLAGYIQEPARSEIYAAFRVLLDSPETEERYVASASATKVEQFTRLGLTDSVLLALPDAKCRLMTADLDLYLAGLRAGLDIVNFSHLRGL